MEWGKEQDQMRNMKQIGKGWEGITLSLKSKQTELTVQYGWTAKNKTTENQHPVVLLILYKLAP